MKLKWVNDDISSQLPSGQFFEFSLFTDKEGCTWVYSVAGLWVYDSAAGKWREDLEKPWKDQPDFVHAVAQDESGKIWLGKDYGGIDVFDKNTGEVTVAACEEGNPRSLSHNTVYCLYSDGNGLMWAGTYKKGVSYYGESMFKFNIYELGDITCVEQEDEDRLWLGTNDRGLLLWNIKTGKTESVYALDAYPVVSLLKASDGQLWAGTFNGGLYHFSGRIYRCAFGVLRRYCRQSDTGCHQSVFKRAVFPHFAVALYAYHD